MKKLLTIIALLIIVGSIYYIFFIFNFAGFKNGKMIVNRNLCEDYCPQSVVEKSWEKIYYGIKNIDECNAVGGTVIPSYAWGAPFRACGVK